MEAVRNPMTFSRFIELLPVALGEENDVPFEGDTLRAIDEFGMASYRTQSGFTLIVEKGIPEERCILRLRTTIARFASHTVRTGAPVAALSYLQYAISTSKLSIRRGRSDDFVILERQISLFDLTPTRMENEISRFCKNWFCALTMLEYSMCPTGDYGKVPRLLRLVSGGLHSKIPNWASLRALPSSSVAKRLLPAPVDLSEQPYPTFLGIPIFTGVPLPRDPILVFPSSARSHKLSHLAKADDGNRPLEHIRSWRALQRSTSDFFGETPEDVLHGQLVYDVEKNQEFWHRMPNGIDLYFKANPCNDGDGDVSIAARIKTLVMNPAGVAKMTEYINAYNGSPYVGTLSLDTDSTVTLWRAMNLGSSHHGEVQRALKEFAVAIADVDDKVTSMTNYVEMPYCAYIGARALSKPQHLSKRSEPSFRESLWAVLQDFGKDGTFAGLDHDAILSIDIKSMSAAEVRNILRERLQHSNTHSDGQSHSVLATRTSPQIANRTSPPVVKVETPQTSKGRYDDFEVI